MTKRDIILTRNALRALDGAGPAGLGREALAEQAEKLGCSYACIAEPKMRDQLSAVRA